MKTTKSESKVTPHSGEVPSKRLVRPTSGGWHKWFQEPFNTPDNELGEGELVLVDAEGTHVVSDDEYLQIVGKSPCPDFCENYWEGTETNQEMMPGFWIKKNPPARNDHER